MKYTVKRGRVQDRLAKMCGITKSTVESAARARKGFTGLEK